MTQKCAIVMHIMIDDDDDDDDYDDTSQIQSFSPCSGQKKKALIVGDAMPGPPMTPRFDSNNVVLLEDNGNPTGTRIKAPIPSSLRRLQGEHSKILALAQLFV